MVVISRKRSLPFLLGIGALICVAEGFVGMYRIIPVTTERIVQSSVEVLTPAHGKTRHRHPLTASSLHASVQEHQSKTLPIAVSKISSQEIHEMASFVCVSLLQSVMAKAMAQDGDGESMDLEALERLTSALQTIQKSDDKEISSSLSSSAVAIGEISGVATEAKPPSIKELEKEPLTMKTEPAQQEPPPLAVETPQEEESITSALVDEGWNEYGQDQSPPSPEFREEGFYDDEFDHEPRVPFREKEFDIFPEGSVPLPRAASTFVVSPLEVVASNVVPLRPGSIPRKKPELSVPGDGETKISINEEEPKQLEVVKEEKIEAFLEEEKVELLEPPKEEKVKDFQEKETDTVFDASKAWDLDEILASTKAAAEETPQQKDEVFLEKQTDIVFEASKAWDLDEILASTKDVAEDATAQAQKNDEELAQRKFLQERLKIDAQKMVSDASRAEELFRRKLLQRRFEMTALETTDASLEDEADSIHDIPIDSKDEMKIELAGMAAQNMADELFHRSLLKQRIEYEKAVATTARNAMQQKMEERFQRKLLAAQLEISARELATSLSVEEIKTKKADELFQRRLLARKLEYDYATLEMQRKKGDDLFRRKLLESTIAYEAARLEKELVHSYMEETIRQKKTNELFRRQLLAKKFEFDSAALKMQRKKDDELFRRKLLEMNIAYEAARIEKELLESSSSVEKFEYAFRAIEMIMEEQDASKANSKMIEHVVEKCTESEEKRDEVVPSAIVDEELTVESEDNEEMTEPTESEIQESIDLSDRDNAIPDEDKVTPKQSKNDRYQSNQSDDWVSSLPTFTQQRYASEARISHSFQFREFNPTGWSVNNHFQTIVGTLYRKEAMYSRGAVNDAGILLDILGVTKLSDEARIPIEEFQWDKRYRVETNDGDFYVADWKYAKGQGENDENPICLICHGLESCSDSKLVKEIAIACNENGIDAACLNFRGCQDSAGSCNLTPRAYHMGFTDDLQQQVEEIHARNPDRRIYLSGFSLGAGVVTNFLTQLGPKAYDYNICGAAVNAVPFDCTKSYNALNGPGFTRTVYGDRLLKSMKTRMGKQYDQCGFPFEKSKIEECETIMDVENLLICPVFGFDDAFDYYNKVKTVDKLQKVCVPQFIIQARDDPFFRGMGEVSTTDDMPLRIQYTDYGGHCGYILHQREPDEKNCKTSWMPRQLARFFAHIEEERGAEN